VSNRDRGREGREWIEGERQGRVKEGGRDEDVRGKEVRWEGRRDEGRETTE